MQSIQEIHKRIIEKKSERRRIAQVFKDELAQHQRYQKIVGEMKTLREERKTIESQVRESNHADAEKFDQLTLDIKTDAELLSDVALNKIVKQEPTEIVDEDKNKWVPTVTVTYKKEE